MNLRDPEEFRKQFDALDVTDNPATIREAFTSPGGKTYQVVDGELKEVEDQE